MATDFLRVATQPLRRSPRCWNCHRRACDLQVTRWAFAVSRAMSIRLCA